MWFWWPYHERFKKSFRGSSRSPHPVAGSKRVLNRRNRSRLSCRQRVPPPPPPPPFEDKSLFIEKVLEFFPLRSVSSCEGKACFHNHSLFWNYNLLLLALNSLRKDQNGFSDLPLTTRLASRDEPETLPYSCLTFSCCFSFCLFFSRIINLRRQILNQFCFCYIFVLHLDLNVITSIAG